MSSSDTKYLIYDKDEIAKRLKEQRKLTGHSQAQLAKKIDALSARLRIKMGCAWINMQESNMYPDGKTTPGL